MTNSTYVDEQIVTALRRIIRAIDLHSRDLMQQCGLTAPQLMALREAGRLARATPGGLAEAIHVSQATMTGILDRLERQGLVARVRDDVDRRSVTITVTEAGKTLLPTAPSLLQDRFRSELAKLSAEKQSAILATLEQIAAMMGAEVLPAAPMLVSGPGYMTAYSNQAAKSAASQETPAIDSGELVKRQRPATVAKVQPTG